MRIALLVVLALLAPSASAASASVWIETSHAVTLRGDVDAAFPGGSAEIIAFDGLDAYRISGATGTLTVWTWDRVTSAEGAWSFTMGDAQSVDFQLANATIEGDAQSSAFGLRLQTAREGAVIVRAPVDATGRPATLQVTTTSDVGASHPVWRTAERLPLRWEAGWTYMSSFLDSKGFPVVDDARLQMRGDVELQVDGGMVRFTDASGRSHAIDLDPRVEGDQLAARQEKAARVFFRGAVLDADVPLAGGWQVAGPRALWSLEGEASYAHASGEVQQDGETSRFEDVPLQLEGTFKLAVAPADSPVADRDRYDGEGDFTALYAGPAALLAEDSADAKMVAVVASLALLAAIAFSALYTRLAPSDILGHPARARLHAVALESPGIHLRDLHRQVGGAWGPFTFHLDVLRRAGHVKFAREGRYVAVYPRAAETGTATPHHPTTRRVLDALPADGSGVALPALRASLGISRQLLDHHVKALEAQGLARRVRNASGVEVQRAG